MITQGFRVPPDLKREIKACFTRILACDTDEQKAPHREELAALIKRRDQLVREYKRQHPGRPV